MFSEASTSVILKPFQEVAEEGTFSYSLYEARITLILKRDKGLTLSLSLFHTHTHYRPVSLMNIDIRILNKISASQIQQYIKRIIIVIKWDLSQG